MKMETSKDLVLDNVIALRSKSYCFSYFDSGADPIDNVQKAKQKGIQHTPHYADYQHCLIISETTHSSNYSIRSKFDKLTLQKQSCTECFG